MGRSIGLDVHREFCQVAIADRGRARSAGRIAASPEMLQLFAQSLAPTDRVVMEATGTALAIARILEPRVAEVDDHERRGGRTYVTTRDVPSDRVLRVKVKLLGALGLPVGRWEVGAGD